MAAGAKGGKPKVKFVDRRMRSDMRGEAVEKGKNGKRRKKGQKRGGVKENAKNNTSRIACLFFQNVRTCDVRLYKKLHEQGY